MKKSNKDFSHLLNQELRKNQDKNVRCPGHAIHFMGFGYEEYVRRVLKLVGVNFESVVKGVKKHESWNPWNPDRLQGVKKD